MNRLLATRIGFPDDFMFHLTKDEWDALKSQFATSKKGREGRRYPPRVFTKHGTIVVANLLNGSTAVHASIQVVRAFVRLRQTLASHKNLTRKLVALGRRYDKRFKVVFDTLRQLMVPPEPERRLIGFQPRPQKRRKKIIK